jgi:hypothetical protein
MQCNVKKMQIDKKRAQPKAQAPTVVEGRVGLEGALAPGPSAGQHCWKGPALPKKASVSAKAEQYDPK